MRREMKHTAWILAAAGVVCGVCLFSLSRTPQTTQRVELIGELSRAAAHSSTIPALTLWRTGSTPPPKVLDCGPDGNGCNLNGIFLPESALTASFALEAMSGAEAIGCVLQTSDQCALHRLCDAQF